MSGSNNTAKDKAFLAWLKEYNVWRPGEPDPSDEGKTEQGWRTLVEYAEDSLRSAFDAGYEACKEDVSNL